MIDCLDTYLQQFHFQVYPITRPPLTPSTPNLPTKDPFIGTRKPSRQEMLFKMSEEKQREKLQKERAKLLEATFMNPIEGTKKPAEVEKKEPEQQRTRMRIPLKRRRKQNEKQRNEVKENKDESFLTPFQVRHVMLKS